MPDFLILWYICGIRGCFLDKNVVYCARTVAKTSSHRHRVAAKPLWVRDRGCDDDVTVNYELRITNYELRIGNELRRTKNGSLT